jgi:hypothetical protein
MSETKNITKALIAFHKTGASAKKAANNPYFKSKYATLEEVIDTARQAGEFGLSFTQLIDFDEGRIFVSTILMHESGETLVSRTPVLVKDMSDPQKMGSGITYAKRYGLQAAFGLPSEDDDGNAAAAPSKSKTPPPSNQPKPQEAF